MITGVLLVQAVTFAVLSGIFANNKNRSVGGWSLLGFFFGLFGFIAVLVVEKVEPEDEQHSSEEKRQSSGIPKFNPEEHEKKCPDCAEYIKLEAQVCKHCGREFSEDEVERQVVDAFRDYRDRMSDQTST